MAGDSADKRDPWQGALLKDAQMGNPVLVARSRVAVESKKIKRGSGSDPKLAEAKRDLAEAKIAAYIERVVAEAPPLSGEQRDRLVSLLRAGRTS